MIVIEYMENGSLDAFLRVSITFEVQEALSGIFCNFSLQFAGKCLREWGVCSRICAVHKYHKSCAEAAAVL